MGIFCVYVGFCFHSRSIPISCLDTCRCESYLIAEDMILSTSLVTLKGKGSIVWGKNTFMLCIFVQENVINGYPKCVLKIYF